MQQPSVFNIIDSENFVHKALEWGQQFDVFLLLNSNAAAFVAQPSFLPTEYDVVIAAGCKANSDISSFELLKKDTQNSKWLFGHINYEANHSIDNITTNKLKPIGFQNLYFFEPEIVITVKKNEALVWANNGTEVFASIITTNIKKSKHEGISTINARVSNEEYLNNVNAIKKHIARGDIYEMNYCIDFYATECEVNPYNLYLQLNEISPAPFSTFYKNKEQFLISASPERFIKKIGNKLYSMPIKGTIKRGENAKQDSENIHFLKTHSKDLSENIMITDLVRNDLSRSAEKGSVKVEELCGIYTFRHLHQMISTVSSTLSDAFHWSDAIKYAFPMGSMTGAPKHSAMQLIDKYEPVSRGLYSGSVGFVSPNGNVDFNVVIRSICYNQLYQYLSFHVGSAITANSVAENEYDECMLKAKAMLMALGIK